MDESHRSDGDGTVMQLQAGDEIVSVDGIEVSDTSGGIELVLETTCKLAAVMEVLRKPSPIASKCRICGTPSVAPRQP